MELAGRDLVEMVGKIGGPCLSTRHVTGFALVMVLVRLAHLANDLHCILYTITPCHLLLLSSSKTLMSTLLKRASMCGEAQTQHVKR